MSFDCQYIEYDELSSGPIPLGPKSIKCQCCGEEIVGRHYVELEIKSDPPRTEKVLTMVRYAHYRRVPLVLSDGSHINLHMCSDCEKEESFDFESDPGKCEMVINQIKNTFMAEDRFARKHEVDVQANAKRWDSIKALQMLSSGDSGDDVIAKTSQAVEKFKAKQKDKDNAGNI